jgi:hypothetical protein
LYDPVAPSLQSLLVIATEELMNARSLAALCLAAVPALAAACTSDGQLGDSGRIRFSQIVHFAETDDFTAPIASGSSVLVTFQDPDTDTILTDGTTVVDLALEVDKANGDPIDSVFPLGFAQYVMILEDAGDYTMVARDGDEVLDSLTVTAEPARSIRLARDVVVTTRSADDCVKNETVASGDVVLHANQALDAYVVPLSDAGDPMVGLLPLTATGPVQIAFDSPLIGHGQMANALHVEPAGEMTDRADLVIDDVDRDFTITWQLATDPADVPLACP